MDLSLLGILLLGLIGGVLIGAAVGYGVGRASALLELAVFADRPDPSDAAGA